MENIKNLDNLPRKAGVYFFKMQDGTILYIGKANDIQKRVKSHFKSSSNIYIKDEIISFKDLTIDYIVTNSEIEALLLEAELIRKYQPLFNLRQKDDSSFPYILITNEKFPRIQFKRKLKGKKNEGIYFGPFTRAKDVRETINFIIRAWKIASCTNKTLPKRRCLKYHINLCSAPCENKISREEYLENVKEVVQFLLGKNKEDIINEKIEKMKKLSDELKFEEAAKVRDQIFALKRTIEHQELKIPQFKIKSGLKDLKDRLGLNKIPEVIEAFDISNIMSESIVGAMVQFRNGCPDKSNYRRFKIKSVNKQNDVATIAEIIRRRYSRVLRENKILPDLILIDGGKAQLNAAIKELENLGIDISNINIIALAKRFDNIYSNHKTNIKLPPSSPALLLLKRIRDEAHRFAISYHRILRSKKFRI